VNCAAIFFLNVPFQSLLTIARLEILLTVRRLDQIAPALMAAFSSTIAATILSYSNRQDLLQYALVGMGTMSIVQTGFMSASEVLAEDRRTGILESLLAVGLPYSAVLLTRILAITVCGLIGVALTYLMLLALFGAKFSLFHPAYAFATLALLTFGTGSSALLLAAMICYSKSARSVQNSLGGPIFLLGGLLVPIELLPAALATVSKLLFVTWGAGLLRDCFSESAPEAVGFRFMMMTISCAVWTAVGFALLNAMLTRLRRQGSLTP
jgi:ABC-2 type transport system permease protein